MSEDEVNKYLNQVAFSSAEEFLSKYKDDATIIGHFGLGFYSAFMVADKVEVSSKSYREEAPAVRWECDGNREYFLESHDKTERGTDIILHINEESLEYLEEGKIRELLNKYCKFLPFYPGAKVNYRAYAPVLKSIAAEGYFVVLIPMPLSLALLDVYGRVERLLVEISAQEDGRAVVRRKLSKQNIAKMVGASREMVSRVMRDLETSGYIVVEEDCIVITGIAGL